MDRNRLLGLSATLVVVTAELNAAGLEYKDAVDLLNRAVVELQSLAKWTPDELLRVGEVQAELIEKLLNF